MNYRDTEYHQSRGGIIAGSTPWGAIIFAVVVLGILALGMMETKTGISSPTLDKAEQCCRVLSGDPDQTDSSGRPMR